MRRIKQIFCVHLKIKAKLSTQSVRRHVSTSYKLESHLSYKVEYSSKFETHYWYVHGNTPLTKIVHPHRPMVIVQLACETAMNPCSGSNNDATLTVFQNQVSTNANTGLCTMPHELNVLRGLGTWTLARALARTRFSYTCESRISLVALGHIRNKSMNRLVQLYESYGLESYSDTCVTPQCFKPVPMSGKYFDVQSRVAAHANLHPLTSHYKVLFNSEEIESSFLVSLE